MRDKDQILLEQAYQTILEATPRSPGQGPYIPNKEGSNTSTYAGTLSNPKAWSPLGEEEANELMIGFNTMQSERKPAALGRLRELEGKEVVLLRGSSQKTSTGYGRDDGSATEPGSGGSVAHTEFEIGYQPEAQGIIQSVKQSEGEEEYTLNGNLILTINGKDYNVNQGYSAKLKFLEDSPEEVHAAGGRSFRNE
jgi:hypothetical protein